MSGVLDVGCGTLPSGDVNCDLFTGKSKHRGYMQMDLTRTPNFVLCDAQYLPFRTNSFDLVRCHHVIEHVPNSFLLLKELIRVSKEHIEIVCPHRYSTGAKAGGHVNFFNVKWFGEALDFISKRNCLSYHTETRLAGHRPPFFHLDIHVFIRKLQSLTINNPPSLSSTSISIVA